jgi:hypothetical protein
VQRVILLQGSFQVIAIGGGNPASRKIKGKGVLKNGYDKDKRKCPFHGGQDFS